MFCSSLFKTRYVIFFLVMYTVICKYIFYICPHILDNSHLFQMHILSFKNIYLFPFMHIFIYMSSFITTSIIATPFFIMDTTSSSLKGGRSPLLTHTRRTSRSSSGTTPAVGGWGGEGGKVSVEREGR